jgi:hypothetical protein
MNVCGACSRDFSSVKMFDFHRVGRHEHLFSESHPEGRRCLSVDEMTSRGWVSNSGGRWSDPALSASVRSHFASASVT